MPSIFTRDGTSSDAEGPVLSVTATIVIGLGELSLFVGIPTHCLAYQPTYSALVLAGLTVAALSVFIWRRRRNAPRNGALRCKRSYLACCRVLIWSSALQHFTRSLTWRCPRSRLPSQRAPPPPSRISHLTLERMATFRLNTSSTPLPSHERMPSL
jgi:hypothetical protein